MPDDPRYPQSPPLTARGLVSGYDPAMLPSLPQRVLPRMTFAMVNGQLVPTEDGPETPDAPDSSQPSPAAPAPLATSREDVDPTQLGALLAHLAHGSTTKGPYTPPQQSSQPTLAPPPASSPAAQQPDYGYGFRYHSRDPKGLGYFGTLQRPDGTGVMGEYSIDEGEGEIPSMVPTLSREELQHILQMQDGDPMPPSIREKAIAHARARRAAGLPVFARPGEQQTDLYPDLPRDQPVARPQAPPMMPSHAPTQPPALQPPQQSAQPPLAVSHAPTALNPPPEPSAWQKAESIRASQAGDTFVPRSFTEVVAQEGGLPRLQALREYLFGGAEQPTAAIRAQPVPEAVTKGFPVTPPGGTPSWRGPNAEHYLQQLPVAHGDAPLPMGRAAELLSGVVAGKFPGLAGELRSGSGLVAPSGEAIESVLARRGASGLAVAPEDSHLLYAPATRLQLPGNGHDPLQISTRVPWAVDRVPRPPGIPLITDWNVVKQEAPEIIPKLAGRLGRSSLLTDAEASQAPEKVVESFITRAKDNLLWLWDQTPQAIRSHSQQWYEGAHVRALEDAPYLRVTPDQSAASIAALSPQNDWFTNAELARRVGYTWREFSDHNPAFTSDLFDAYRQMVLNTNAKKIAALSPRLRAPALRELEAKIAVERSQYQGQAFNDLPLAGRARMIRAFSQNMHPRQFPMILPNGGLGDIVKNDDGRTARLGWSVSYPMLENAISALDDGSPENLSRLLGDAHKVRSFYNNIIHPWDPHSVTIDTHAVAAAHLSPFAQSADEVNYAMGGVQHALSGIKGANAVYAEAYKRAAAERGVLPRQMQSVTWESLRGLFSPSQKDDAAFVGYIQSLWDQHRAGTMTLDQVRDAIHYAAGRITEPPWAATLTRPAPR